MKLTRMLVFGLAASLAAGCGEVVEHSHSARLVPGPFAGLAGASLGPPLEFTNDIDSHLCLPLNREGSVIAWIAEAYSGSGVVLVRRCESSAAPEVPGQTAKEGDARKTWDEIRLEGNGRVTLLPRIWPLWTTFANPNFCDALMAYWGLEHVGDDTILRPTILNLDNASVVRSTTTGPVLMATDFEGFLDQPEWDANCTTATFEGNPVDKPTLVVRGTE